MRFHSIRRFVSQLRLDDLYLPALLSVITAITVYKNQFTDLHMVEDGMIGIASYDGVDIGARIRKFYITGLSLFLSFILFTWLTDYLYRIRKVDRLNRLLIANFSLCALIVHFSTGLLAPQWHILAKIFAGFPILIFLHPMLIRPGADRWRLTSDKTNTAAVISIILGVVTIHILQLDGMSAGEDQLIWITILLFALLLCFFSYLSRRDADRMLSAAVPLGALPLSAIVSNEVWLVLTGRGTSIDHLSLYLIFSGVLTGWSVLRWVGAGRKPAPTRNSTFWLGFWTVAGLATLASYQTQLHWEPEHFETANRANAAMNLFHFGKIPFADFFTSHLLSDQIHTWLYALVHGYRPNLDFLVYSFYFVLFTLILAYTFLSLVFRRPWFALFYTAVIPVILIQLPVSFSMGLLSFVALWYYFKKQHLISFLLFLLACSFTMLWRIDTAVMSLPAALFCLLLWVWHTRSGALLLKHALRGLLLIGIPLAGIIVYFLIAHPRFASNLRDALGYIGGSQAHGFPEILHGGVMTIHLPNFILPTLVILLSLVVCFRYLKARAGFADMLVVVFLTIVYLLNFQRGLVRHATAAEGFDNFISSFVYFLIPFQIVVVAGIRRYRTSIFLAASFLIVFSFKTPQPRERMTLFASDALASSLQLQITDSGDLVERVHGYTDIKTAFSGLDSFMSQNFSREASFIDLSNTPMLYYYLQREIPGYFCQYTQNMVTASIQERNIPLLESMNLPVTVFSSWPAHEFFDRTDGVENTLRYYRLAAYIFENYEPLGVVSEKYLWLEKGRRLRYNNTSPLPEATVYAPQRFELRKLPYFWAKAKLGEGGEQQAELLIPGAVPEGLECKTSDYLLVRLQNDSGTPQTLDFSYYVQGERAGGFNFWISEEKNATYLIPVSTQYNWSALPIDSMTFDSPHPESKVMEVKLYRDL